MNVDRKIINSIVFSENIRIYIYFFFIKIIKSLVVSLVRPRITTEQHSKTISLKTDVNPT